MWATWWWACTNGKPVYLREVAHRGSRRAQASSHVWYTPGQTPADTPAAASPRHAPHRGPTRPSPSRDQEARPERGGRGPRRPRAPGRLRNTVVPADVEATITRDYGVTAAEKANKLIQKLAFATGSVILLVGLALGRREAVIVGAAVILTLTATLFASWAWGFTLNRVSPVRADLLHRHPGGRRHRGGGEHPPSPAAHARQAAARDHPRGGRRSRWPHHPGHADGDCGPAAHGLRERPDGAVHEPHPHQLQPGHGPVAGHRLHGDPVAGAQVDEVARRPGTRCRGGLRR
jgi:hypothetical protein